MQRYVELYLFMVWNTLYYGWLFAFSNNTFKKANSRHKKVWITE